ncbi:MAG: TolC family outer membrane protein [Rhodospirillaceae bacterium]
MAILGGIFASALVPHSAASASLVEIFRQAQVSDAAYASARATWGAAQERVPQGRSGLLPQVTLSADAQRNDRQIQVRDPRFPTSSTTFSTKVATLSITQPLYRRQNQIAYEQAKTQATQADAELSQAAQDLVLRVAQAYFDILLAEDNVGLIDAQKAAIQLQLEQAKRNFEVGTATITDTHEAQARYDLASAQEISSRNDLELRRRALEEIIASPVPPLSRLSAGLVLSLPQPPEMNIWVDEALQGNLLVKAAEAGVAIASQSVARSRTGHYPTLDLTANYQEVRAGAGVQGTFSPGFDARLKSIGMQLFIPLYQGGLVSSSVREAIVLEDRAHHELDRARRAAEFNARQAYLGVTNGVAQVRALEAAQVSSEAQLNSTRRGQQVGVRTQVDVLNAQQQLTTARRDLAQARYNYILSVLRLKAAIGQLTEEDLIDVNKWLSSAYDTDSIKMAQRRPSAR